MDTDLGGCVRHVQTFLDSNRAALTNRELVVCWSGGKDSTALLALLCAAGVPRTRSVRAVAILYPHVTVQQAGVGDAVTFWRDRGVQLDVIEVGLPDPSSESPDPCMQCKRARRDAFARACLSRCDPSATAILTGHTCSDLAAYLIELVAASVATVDPRSERERRARRLELLNKFLPVYTPHVGPALARPLSSLSDTNCARVLELCRVPHPLLLTGQTCPWFWQRKRLFHEYFTQSGLGFEPNALVTYIRQHFGIPTVEEFGSQPLETYVM